MLSQATRLLALVSAPSLEATIVRHVEVLAAPPAHRHGRADHVDAAASASGSFDLEEPVDPGLANWAHEYLNERVAGLRLGTSLLRRRFADPELTPRERGVPRPASSGVRRARRASRATRLYIGGAAGLLGDARGLELEACQRLLELLERRAAVLELLSDALDPNLADRSGRAARSKGVSCATSPTSARPTASRTGRSAPWAARPAADGLRERDPVGAGGRVRAVAPRRGRLRGRLSARRGVAASVPLPVATTERDTTRSSASPRGAERR